MKNEYAVTCKDRSHFLKKEEYARWLCLIEAIDLINTKALELNTDLNKDDFWLKPLAFQKYIESRLETMLLDIDREENNVDIIKVTAEKARKNLIIEKETSEDDEIIENFNNTPHILESY
jgi:hypothetical protein